MFAIVVRVLFAMFCIVTGVYFLEGLGNIFQPNVWGVLWGAAWATAILFLEWALRRTPPKGLVAGSIGLLIGLILANLITGTVLNFPFTPEVSLILRVGIALALGYLGMTVSWRKRDEFKFLVPQLSRDEDKKCKILDTSVIIDGRIADIAETGFLEGLIVIPKFILNELQKIADSTIPLRRKRGRRGLDILNRMQKSGSLEVVIEEKDFPDIKEVDSKLVQLARTVNGIIVTNDYNLNKIAKLQGVAVFNINELANALKPVILPSEELKIRIVKEGKEPNQGIAYLDDGTMVVVENARGLMGEEVTVEVTSVLQTSAGRMIFGQQQKGTGGDRSRSSKRS
ncbi:MAG: TRAM domain-containing protein [Candidatus Omnitrophica bacterium]|nr:TRAM domain-containing protein [Candidatus Omnitrophota bacterium]MBU1047522.1 TRAM domain-containing protein [Candidatus Omnitrophota bacterium]MBU1630602.1 TRAM domain-containing protein [Candidatus Omnitrophota bacterium]MBU1767345.1 TRAM domain-containing protein [Candidatus Omnitrophota bacterium]MBU1888885.1 TRAM domain-containing protein [Candidatus Omnitrophota bacterium]